MVVACTDVYNAWFEEMLLLVLENPPLSYCGLKMLWINVQKKIPYHLQSVRVVFLRAQIIHKGVVVEKKNLKKKGKKS